MPREALARLVGSSCNLDDLIADIREDLRARPYELVYVAGGYQLRTKPRFAPAIRAASGDGFARRGRARIDADRAFGGDGDRLSATSNPRDLSRLAGREISRDVIGALKRHGLIDGALRAPEPGAPFAYVTTRKFLEVFGLATLRDLPDIEQLRGRGPVERPQSENDIDAAVGGPRRPHGIRRRRARGLGDDI